MKIEILIVIIFFLFSCTKDRTINLKTEKKQLVVNCTFNPDSTWKLWLSSTISIGENSEYFPAINNATIQLLENGNSIGIMQNVDEGFYTLNSKPSLGNIYSIKISANGFDNVEATDSFPKTKGMILEGKLSNIFVQKKAPPPWVDIFYDVLPVSLKMNDNASEKNYYKVQAFVYVVDSAQIDSSFYNPKYNYRLYPTYILQTEDNRFQSLSYEQYSILFEDAQINGSAYFMDAFLNGVANISGRLFIEPRYVSIKEINPYYNGIIGAGLLQVKDGTGDWKLDYYVELQTLSETYYKYNKTRLLQQYNSKIPGAEFNNVYSNVKGGKGIFGAYLSHKLKLN